MEIENKDGGVCENCGVEYSWINRKNPNRKCLHCGHVGFGGNLTPDAADDAKAPREYCETCEKETIWICGTCGNPHRR